MRLDGTFLKSGAGAAAAASVISRNSNEGLLFHRIREIGANAAGGRGQINVDKMSDSK